MACRKELEVARCAGSPRSPNDPARDPQFQTSPLADPSRISTPAGTADDWQTGLPANGQPAASTAFAHPAALGSIRVPGFRPCAEIHLAWQSHPTIGQLIAPIKARAFAPSSSRLAYPSSFRARPAVGFPPGPPLLHEASLEGRPSAFALTPGSPIRAADGLRVQVPIMTSKSVDQNSFCGSNRNTYSGFQTEFAPPLRKRRGSSAQEIMRQI